MVVGTGIQLLRQLTPETRDEFDGADELLFVVADPALELWLQEHYPSARSLSTLYRRGVPRRRIYDEMVSEILEPLRRGSRVCAAFYGHPGVFVAPSHEAIRQARAEGYPARMLPAVSAESCLIADLGVDPGEHGWQSYEATRLLLRGHSLDPTAAVVLWQVDAVGKLTWNLDPEPRGLRVLCERLRELYPPDHEVIFYRASLYPVADPIIEPVRSGRARRTRRGTRPDALHPAAPTARSRPGHGPAPRPHTGVTPASRKARAQPAETRFALRS